MQRKEKKNAYMPHYFHGKQTNGQNKIRYGGKKWLEENNKMLTVIFLGYGNLMD